MEHYETLMGRIRRRLERHNERIENFRSKVGEGAHLSGLLDTRDIFMSVGQQKVLSRFLKAAEEITSENLEKFVRQYRDHLLKSLIIDAEGGFRSTDEAMELMHKADVAANAELLEDLDSIL